MKKLIGLVMVLALGVLLWMGQAGAELSTNLRIETVPDSVYRNKPGTETYVDAEGNPVVPSDKGYATVRYTYGLNKLVSRIELLDAEGNLVNGVDGYARIERQYSLKKLSEQTYYDAAGNLVNGPEGYARQTTKERFGNFKEVWEYDADGNPVNKHQVIQYQHAREIKSECWYDAENNPVAGPNGYARMEIEYSGSTQIKIAYYDADGNPYYYAKAKYARMEREVSKGQVTAMRYYGADDELIPGPAGYAYVLYSYPNKHTREMYYSPNSTLSFRPRQLRCRVEKSHPP